MATKAKPYWWTVCGHRGDSCHIMAHATESDMLYHYSLARNLGGDFDTIGHTRRPMTQAKFVSLLSDRFTGYELAIVGEVTATA